MGILVEFEKCWMVYANNSCFFNCSNEVEKNRNFLKKVPEKIRKKSQNQNP